MNKLLGFSLGALVLIPYLFVPVTAQEIHRDVREVVKAQVIKVISETEQFHPGLDVTNQLQVIEVEILEGPEDGKIVEVENDYFQLEAGDVFFMNHIVDINGYEFYTVSEPDRSFILTVFVALFVGVVLAFGRWQGLRALAALAASFFVIFYILIPQLRAGLSPVFLSMGVAIAILAIAMVITHGFNKKTISAFLGTMVAILLTGVLGWIGVKSAQLSGFVSDDVVYLNLGTGGTLDLGGLLLGAIIIGALGLLDDVAITQASAVKEFFEVNVSPKEAYRKAMNIGREHVGALVNTLALAYAGVALPLLLLFSTSEAPLVLIINREVFASEIIRTVVGSIGIVLAVPITTLISVLILSRDKK